MAAAAYRSGERLEYGRYGEVYDYTKRTGVLQAELVLPEGAGEGWTREKLWNAAEEAERRKDARTAREWVVALPSELEPAARREAVMSLARELAGRYGCAVDVAIHAPDREGDQRNYHAHLLTTTRTVTAEGLGEKCALELRDAKRRELGLGPARQEIEAIRALWAETANRQLERAGVAERVDHRSLERQGAAAQERGDMLQAELLDREPQIKLGWKVVAMERRGRATERGELQREILARNEQHRAEVIAIDKARQQQQEKERQAAQERAQALQRQQEAERQARAHQERLEAEKQARQQAREAVEAALRGKTAQEQQDIIQGWRKLARQAMPDPGQLRAFWEEETGYQAMKAALPAQRQALAAAEKAYQEWPRFEKRFWAARHGPHSAEQEQTKRYWAREDQAQAVQEAEERLAALDAQWPQDQPRYQAKLQQKAEQIQQAREASEILWQQPEYFQRFRDQEAQAAQQAPKRGPDREFEGDRGVQEAVDELVQRQLRQLGRDKGRGR